MDNKKIQHYFLLALLFGVIILAFFVLRPFLYVIILALIGATFFEPIHHRIGSFVRNKSLAALVTTLIMVIIILVPFIFLGINILREAQQFYSFLMADGGKDIVSHVSASVANNLQTYLPFSQNFSVDIDQYIRQWALWLLDNLGYMFGSITKLVFNFFIFLIIVYYLFRDGKTFRKSFMHIVPLADGDSELIFRKIKDTVNSVIKGSLIVALVQGILASIGFALFGLPNFILWGIAATLASLIPGVGTAIVIIPAVAFIFFTKGIWVALGLLAWGIIIVGLVDNFLRPLLIGKGLKIHPLIIFLSVIGGIVFFGPIGFLLGPLTISLLVVLFDLYLSARNDL